MQARGSYLAVCGRVAQQFSQCVVEHINDLHPELAKQLIAIDEKTIQVAESRQAYKWCISIYLVIKCEAEDFLMRKAHRNHLLSEADEKFNRGVSRIRVRVEHVFGRMKQLGMDYV